MKLLKNEFVVLTALFVLIGAAGAIYFYQQSQSGQPAETTKTLKPEQEIQEPLSQELVEKELAAERILEDDLYEIIIPQGWVRAEIDSDRFLSLVIKPEGQIDLANIADIDYDTYYAVNNTKMEADSLDEYVDLLKQNLLAQIPSIEFIRQSYGTIDGRDSIYLESESEIEGKNYKTLLVFVGDRQWVWAISFNTLTDSWDENKSVFYEIANSLAIK